MKSAGLGFFFFFLFSVLLRGLDLHVAAAANIVPALEELKGSFEEGQSRRKREADRRIKR